MKIHNTFRRLSYLSGVSIQELYNGITSNNFEKSMDPDDFASSILKLRDNIAKLEITDKLRDTLMTHHLALFGTNSVQSNQKFRAISFDAEGASKLSSIFSAICKKYNTDHVTTDDMYDDKSLYIFNVRINAPPIYEIVVTAGLQDTADQICDTIVKDLISLVTQNGYAAPLK